MTLGCCQPTMLRPSEPCAAPPSVFNAFHGITSVLGPDPSTLQCLCLLRSSTASLSPPLLFQLLLPTQALFCPCHGLLPPAGFPLDQSTDFSLWMEQAGHSGEDRVVLRRWAHRARLKWETHQGNQLDWGWCHTPLTSRGLIPAKGGRGRQIYDFEASLVYIMSFKTARAM